MSKLYNYGEQIDFDEIIIKNYSDLEYFDCGNKDLNDYMFECIKEENSTIHALIDKKLNKIIGVCFLKCSAYVEKSGIANYTDDGDLDEDNPFNYSLSPAIEILYFAIDKNYQDLPYNKDKKNGCISNIYLNMMIDNIIKSSEDFSKAKYILLYAVDSAYEFYCKNYFSDFYDNTIKDSNEWLINCTPMFLELP